MVERREQERDDGIKIKNLEWLLFGGHELAAESAISFLDHKAVGVKTYFQSISSFCKTTPIILDLILY